MAGGSFGDVREGRCEDGPSVIGLDDQHTDINISTCQGPIKTTGVDQDEAAHESEPIERCKFAGARALGPFRDAYVFCGGKVTYGPQKRTRLPRRVRRSRIVFRGSRRTRAAATPSSAAGPIADAERAAPGPLAAAAGCSGSARCKSGHATVRTMGRPLCGRPVGLYERARLALGPGRNDHDRRRWRPLRLPLHAERRLDLVRLALGAGPVSLRGMGSSDLAPGRMAWRLGGDAARFHASGRSHPTLSSLMASPGRG